MSFADQLPAGIAPAYDRASLGSGIVHIGAGAFHRAHQAAYTDAAIAAAGGNWLITGVSLRSAGSQAALTQQDHYYSIWTRDQEKDSVTVIGALSNSLSASNDGADKIINTIAHPSTRIVSLTITEKGYCHNARRELDERHPDIEADLRSDVPTSAIAYLVRGLARRTTPVTVMSCDNVSDNGGLTRNLVLALAQHLTPEETGRIGDLTSFPSTMVDRIVPATNAAVRQQFAERWGYRDAAVVVGEPWSQWVIENRFAADRPRWELAGAAFVENVAPFESAKLRLLNASHSVCAFLGLLKGYEYVHESMADPDIRQFLVALLRDEITPTVPTLPHFDIDHYCESVLARFANSAIPYRNAQVATDSSQKLPQRILPSIKDRFTAGQTCEKLAQSVAAWVLCVQQSLIPSDPMLAELQEKVAREDKQPVEALLATSVIFADLGRLPAFIDQVKIGVKSIQVQLGLNR